MAEYDGEVRIRAIIENGDATSSILQMEAMFQKLAKGASKLNDEMRDIEQMKIPTEEYKSLQNQFDTLVAKGKKLSETLKDTEKYVPSREYLETEKVLDSVSAKQDHLREKMKEWVALGKETNSTSYKKMEMNFETLGQQADRLIQRLEEMDEKGQDKQLSDKWKNIKDQMAQAGAEASKVKAQMRDMEVGGTANVDPKSTAEYQKKAEKLREVKEQMDILNQKMVEVADKEEEAGAASSNLEKIVSTANRIKNAFSGVVKTIGNFGSKAVSICGKVIGGVKNAANKISGLFKKSNGLLNTFSSRLKGISLSLLIFNWITKAFNAMVTAFKEGIQNMAKYSADFNSRMSELKSATSTLKASLGTLAAPIVSAVIPAIVTLCNWITTAVNKMNELVAALSGKSTWTRAKQQQVDYAKSLNSTTGAAKKAAGALQSFDELNVINSNSSGSSGGSGTGNATYEEMPISDSIKKIKDILAGEDWTELGKIIADKVNDAMKNIPWDSIQAEAEKTGKRLGTLINGFVSEFDWNLLGNTIAQGINTALIFANTFLKTVDWTKLGAGFATGINGLVDNLDWSLLGTTISNGFNMAIDTFYGFVSTLDWTELGSSIGESIQTALSNIHWENVGKGLSDGIIGLLTMLTNAIYEIDWQKLGDDVATALENIDWSGIADALFEAIGAALGGLAAFLVGLIGDAWDEFVNWWYDTAFEDGEFTIAGLLEGIVNALSDIGTWIYEHIFKPFIDGFKNAFGIHSPSTVMAEMGGYIIEGLRNGLTGIWDRVSDIIGRFKDNMKKSFTDVKENAISTFKNMKENVKSIFENMWSGVKNIINTMLGGVEKMANGVINGLNSMIEAMNQLSWDIPDWVPKIGGNKFGLSIPTINNVSIPRLANGGITTGSTIANIGEAGREAVLPLENNLSYLEPLAEMIASKMEGVQTVKIVPDESGLFKVVRESANDYYRRTGRPAFDF